MSEQILKALSPWAAVDVSEYRAISPRLDSLEGKTIGMFGDFMVVATMMLKSVEKELSRRYPTAKFSYIQYKTETTQIARDAAFKPEFDAWAAGVDCILCFFGSVPSSSLFLGYNAAYMEKLGKPTAMLVMPRTLPTALRGCKAMGVPDVRTIAYDPKVDVITAHVDQAGVDAAMAVKMDTLADDLVAALTAPLTDAEADPVPPKQEYAERIYEGTSRQIAREFYRLGFTNGQPIDIPTREAVDEMLRGTDLPPDHVVGYLPPMMGAATVERIAVNAVMAGCLPTYMPVLIAAVKGALDPRILLEGWTCSQSTWGPMITLSGPVVKDIGLNTKDNCLSPYYKPNACIARAFGYIMMNIAGLRPAIEDLSEMGHENRLGLCIGDDPDNNPWQPLHVDFGFAEGDSAVTMFWPQEHRAATKRTAEDALDYLATMQPPYGWEPGLAIVMTPILAKTMADAGWTKQAILDYIVEYARRPASEADLPWLIGNNHIPEPVHLPVKMTHSTRVYWDARHMFCLVGGGKAGPMMTIFGGGGDHGGPSCTKIELPRNWNALVEEYADVKPDYISY